MNLNKGITLVSLVVTIIVILILAGTATYVGYDAIQTSSEQRFLSQLKEVNEAVNLHTEDYKYLGLIPLETEVTFNNNVYNYRLVLKEDYEKIGLSNVEDIIYVNFDTGQIYSENGINGKHTLKDFGVEYYKPTQENITEQNNISFDVKLEPQQYSWKYIVNNSSIICNGNVQDGNLFYSEYIDGTNHSWKRVERVSDGFALEIKQPGIYELKYRDSLGNESDIKQVYAYVKDGLQLYYDGEYNENYKHNSEATTWEDLSGNENDGELNSVLNDNNSVSLINSDSGIVGIYKDNLKLTDLTIDFTISSYSDSAIIYDFHQSGKYGYFLKIVNNNLYIAFGLFRYTYDLDFSIAEYPMEITLICSKSNGYIKLYINGEEKYVYNGEIDINKSPETKFGLLNNDMMNEGAFKGKLNQFKIYERCLNENEVKLNYQNDQIRFGETSKE